MKLHISPSLGQVTLFRAKGVKEFSKVNVGVRGFSYSMMFYSFLFFLLLVRCMFVLTALDSIDGRSKCTSIGCLGRRLGPGILGRSPSTSIPEEMYQVLEEQSSPEDYKDVGADVPMSFGRFVAEMNYTRPDARTFALKLKSMVNYLEQKTRAARIQEVLYRHVASSSIPKELHCLALRLTNEHATNSAARLQLPLPEQVPNLVDNSFFHFVLASDNVLAASVVANSLVRNSLRPEKVVLHIITDKKTYSAMHAWFALHSLAPAVIEVKELHHFDWFSKGKVPVLEVMEKDHKARSKFGGGSQMIVKSDQETPRDVAARLQAMSPKYNSMMNHIRIHLPELFPSLNKVVFLDDDIVIQTDLSPLWEIDMKGKVNGAVQTCRGKDEYVMSKRFKNYLNFSNPLIADGFDPEECAWAYGMNVFDLEAWRKSNISATYYHWLEQNVKSGLSLYQLGHCPRD